MGKTPLGNSQITLTSSIIFLIILIGQTPRPIDSAAHIVDCIAKAASITLFINVSTLLFL